MTYNQRVWTKRIIIYCTGIFFFALGVAFAIKSDLGVSPVSTVPYVASLVLNGSIGMMTAILYMIFVGVQRLLLGKDFKARELLQLVFALLFGSFVDFSNHLIRNMDYGSIGIQVVYLVTGIVLISYGIFLILKADIIVSPTDGLVIAIALKFGVEFSKIKIAVDLGAAIIAAFISFMFFGRIYGVGIGTIISAVGVGSCIKFFDTIMGTRFVFNGD